MYTTIPLQEILYVSYGNKKSVFDFRLGYSISELKETLYKKGLRYQYSDREVQIEMTDFGLSNNSVNLSLAVGFDTYDKITYFYFFTKYQSEKERTPFSPTLAELSLLLHNAYNPLSLIKYNFDHKGRTSTQEAWYSSYYDIIHLRRIGYDVSMTIMSKKEYEQSIMPIWKKVYHSIIKS